MNKQLRELFAKREGLLNEAEAAKNAKNSEVFKTKMNEIKALDIEIDELKDLEAAKGRFSDLDEEMKKRAKAIEDKKKNEAMKAKVDQIRSTNEYVQAFVNSLAAGYTVKTGKNVPELQPLYNALTETGGTPVGSEGGFLVPIDIDNTIKEFRRAMIALADYVNVETVTTLSGWRAVETAKAAQPFALIAEMAQVGAAEEPRFTTLSYNVAKYGGFIPVSNELLNDNAANLMAYLGRWMGRKSVLTENSLILAIINAMTAVPFVAADGINNLKQVLNVTLDPAISVNATILTNQSGFNYLDQLEDLDGRPLLQPDPTRATGKLMLGRPVVVAPNSLMPNRNDGTNDFAPVVIGDLREFITMFNRMPYEMASTNIGGNAWRTDSTEIRGLVRLDCQQVDDGAAAKLEIQL